MNEFMKLTMPGELDAARLRLIPFSIDKAGSQQMVIAHLLVWENRPKENHLSTFESTCIWE